MVPTHTFLETKGRRKFCKLPTHTFQNPGLSRSFEWFLRTLFFGNPGWAEILQTSYPHFLKIHGGAGFSIVPTHTYVSGNVSFQDFRQRPSIRLWKTSRFRISVRDLVFVF